MSIVLILLNAPVAKAQSETDLRGKTQVLYEEAIRAMSAKDYATACPKLEEVVHQYPEGLGAWIELGRCEEARGRYARAFEVYTTAEAAASEAGQKWRSQRARQLARDLEPRLSKWIILVPDSVKSLSGVRVRNDGVELPRTQWDQMIAVDGGRHVITVEAAGKQTWIEKVDVARERDVVTVHVPLLDDVDVPSPHIESTPPSSNEIASSRPSISPTGVSPLRAAGFVGGGIGVAGLVGSAIAGGFALARHNDAIDNAHCVDGRCDATGGSLETQSRSAGTASTALFVVGSVFLAGGITMTVMSYRRTDSDVRVLVGTQGITINGKF